MIRVILAGEGKNELGGFAVESAFRDEIPEPGVLEALLKKVCPEGFRVVDAILWKKTPKLQVGIGGKGEELNVLRAHHHAKKRGCDVLVFTRDRDKAKFAHRETDIERAIESLANANPPSSVASPSKNSSLGSPRLRAFEVRKTCEDPRKNYRSSGSTRKTRAQWYA